MKKLLCFIFIFLTFNFSHSQSCGFDKKLKNSIKLNTKYEMNLVKKIADLTIIRKRQVGNDDIIIIPVVFNLVYPNNQPQGTGTITLSDLEREIEKLNKAFSGDLGQHIKVDTKIRFCLARNDVFGKDRLGVNRYNGYSSYQPYIDDTPEEERNHFERIDAILKQNRNSNFPSSTFLNVWITDLKSSDNSDGFLGYSSFPFDIKDIDEFVETKGNPQDGVVLDYTQLVSGNRTLTHEVGHWLGLLHTFQNLNINLFGAVLGSCEETNSYTQGDLVYDTDPMDGSINPYTNIAPGENCTGFDCDGLETKDVQNYMYYYSDGCSSFFSQGQKERIRDVLNEYRPFIANGLSNHCEITGNEPDAPPFGGGSSGGNNCGKCYTPSLKIPFDFRANWGNGNRLMKHRSKGTLHVRFNKTQSSINNFEIVFSRRLCNQLVEEGFLNLNYTSGDYSSNIFIIDDNTFVANLFKKYRSNFSEIKVFKKTNNNWVESKTININGFLLEAREGRTYLRKKVEGSSSGGGNLYSYDLSSETSVLIFNSASFPSKRVRLTEKGYNISSSSGFNFQEWVYNSSDDSYILKESHNFPKPEELSRAVIYVRENYAITSSYREDAYIYKKNNGIWKINQRLPGVHIKDDNSLISDKYFISGRVLDGNFCHANIFYKKNSNGFFEEITDYSHMDAYSNNPVTRLTGHLMDINTDQNEILLSDHILKLSDILKDDSFNNFNSSIQICSEVTGPIKAKNIIIGGNCSSIINNSAEVIATNRIVIKPSTHITSSKLFLGILNVNTNDCGFNTFCVTSSRKSNIENDNSFFDEEESSKTKIGYIFPNPNKGEVLNFRNYEKIVHLEIYSLAGFLKYSTKNIQSKIIIPNIGSGIFNIRLYTVDGGVINEKLIIKQ